ncbi:hypothetical protein SBRCBS47491_009841 [Sporothrix bragantina]|uniref:PNPLA domain-containing protein n=1 Tax=Sporothrix bragantina TaxID=671064 RepID=A0ABP0CY78_9PEZI
MNAPNNSHRLIASQGELLMSDVDWAAYEVAVLGVVDMFAADCRDHHDWDTADVDEIALLLESLGCDKIGRLVQSEDDEVLPVGEGCEQHEKSVPHEQRVQKQQQQAASMVPASAANNLTSGPMLCMAGKTGRRPPYGYSVGLMAEYVAEMANNLVLARAPSSAKLCTLLYGLLAETRLPGATVLLGMTYFSKRVKMLCLARRVERLPVSEADQWHLLVVAIVLGSKFLDDVTYSNTSWAEVSAVPKAELGKLERDWLGAVRWSLFVDLDLDDDYNAWIASWQGWLYTKSFQMTQNVSAAAQCLLEQMKRSAISLGPIKCLRSERQRPQSEQNSRWRLAGEPANEPAARNDILWLGLRVRGTHAELFASSRLQRLVESIPDPDTQRPSLVVFVGKRSKAAALRENFGVKRTWLGVVKRARGEVHLHLDPSSVFGQPLLIADGDILLTQPTQKAPASQCHEITVRAIHRPSGVVVDDLVRGLFGQLLFPFTDVFCFFCEDLGGLQGVARLLASWLEGDRSTALPAAGGATQPSVVLVTETWPVGKGGETKARSAFLWYMRSETAKNVLDYVAAVEVVALLPKGAVSTTAQYRLLKERLLDGSDNAQKRRREAGLSFSATHLAALVECGLDAFASLAAEPFCFIKASRAHSPVAPNLAAHLRTLIERTHSVSELSSFAAPVLASSFLLDSYPPGAHLFPPGVVFDQLYKGPLTEAVPHRVMTFAGSTDVLLRAGFVRQVRQRFHVHFTTMTGYGRSTATPAADVHRDTLARFQRRWRSVYSSETCLSCHRRRPHVELPCGHAVCENCVAVYGQPCAGDVWLVRLPVCLLCGAALPDSAKFRLHPPTAGVGVLCIDGGGIRGVVPLQLLKRIENRVGLPIAFQRFVKVAFGVSSGGLIAADLFINGHSVDETLDRFVKLAKRVFQPRGAGCVSSLPPLVKLLLSHVVDGLPPLALLVRAAQLLVSYFSDGLYRPEGIETALREAFGPERNIMDVSHATASGTRLGLPVATVQDKPSCRVFTNYNGVGDRSRGPDQVVQSAANLGRVPLWEIARAASAAPGFFPPKHIHGVGTFQDAGPLENDPLVSALAEVAALFPLVDEPDFVVSLGTGEPKPSPYPASAAPRSVWRNGAFPRLCRLFWEKMRDRKVRQAFQAHPRYHRLDVQFDGDEPRLDDAASMSEIMAVAQNDATCSDAIDDVARSIVASLFYFELDSIPRRENGRHRCSGRILCAIQPSEPAFAVLVRRLASSAAQFWVDGSVVAELDEACIGSSGGFQKRIEFDACERFAIALKQDPAGPCHISGSPFTVRKLLHQQGLLAVFGRSDHRKRKRPGSPDPDSKRRRAR